MKDVIGSIEQTPYGSNMHPLEENKSISNSDRDISVGKFYRY